MSKTLSLIPNTIRKKCFMNNFFGIIRVFNLEPKNSLHWSVDSLNYICKSVVIYFYYSENRILRFYSIVHSFHDTPPPKRKGKNYTDFLFFWFWELNPEALYPWAISSALFIFNFEIGSCLVVKADFKLGIFLPQSLKLPGL